MKFKNKLGFGAGAALLLVLAACGGDGSLFSLGSAGSDRSISSTEAAALLSTTSETGDPDNVSTLTLATSETDEPFDLAD